MAYKWLRMLALSGWSRAEDFIIIFSAKFLCCPWPTVRIEKGTGAEMRPAMVCGIVTGRVGKLLESLSFTYTANVRFKLRISQNRE